MEQLVEGMFQSKGLSIIAYHSPTVQPSLMVRGKAKALSMSTAKLTQSAERPPGSRKGLGARNARSGHRYRKAPAWAWIWRTVSKWVLKQTQANPAWHRGEPPMITVLGTVAGIFVANLSRRRQRLLLAGSCLSTPLFCCTNSAAGTVGGGGDWVVVLLSVGLWSSVYNRSQTYTVTADSQTYAKPNLHSDCASLSATSQKHPASKSYYNSYRLWPRHPSAQHSAPPQRQCPPPTHITSIMVRAGVQFCNNEALLHALVESLSCADRCDL